jgi:hypothetical protein
MMFDVVPEEDVVERLQGDLVAEASRWDLVQAERVLREQRRIRHRPEWPRNVHCTRTYDILRHMLYSTCRIRH